MPGLKTLARGALDETSLGSLVIGDGIVDRARMDELLSEFKSINSGGYFGQFLIEKGVLSREKLELLLIRQSAVRAGGATRKHVRQAMDVAHKTSQRIMDDVEEFMTRTQSALMKVGKD